MLKRTNPGDAANIFIRCLLSDISVTLGGFSKDEWEKTQKYFDFSCAYTGQPLTNETAVMDHIIPHNRKSCGLHIYGNIAPSSKEANGAKGSQDFREFLRNDKKCLGEMSQEERELRVQKIEKFMSESEYDKKLANLRDLELFCHREYEMIKSMCQANKNYFQAQLQVTPEIEEEEKFEYFIDELSRKQNEDEGAEADNQLAATLDEPALRIGKFAWKKISDLFVNNKIEADTIKLLTSKEQTKEILGANFPLFRKVEQGRSLQEQTRGNDGHIRYYKTPVQYQGNTNEQYLVCNDWYERNREKLLLWLLRFQSKA